MAEDGLFDRSQMEDEAFDPLPPPLSPGQDQGDPFADDDENGEVSKLADVPEVKRKGVKRPQPKLDANRLISDRGLPALRTLFNNINYKGKGHEAEDLRQLMKMMENWAHRLFPKLQFEDFIDKVERLGSKKEVQTCLKRIRLDMPLTHDDYTNKDGEEEELPPEVQIFGDPDPFGGEHLSNSPLSHLVHSTPAPSANPNPAPLPSSSSPPPALTEEQRRRMEENRLKALEKRLARQQQQQQQQQTESQPVESQPVESQPVPPTEDSTDVTSETVLSVSQVQEEVPDLDLEPLISSGSTQQQQEQEQSSQPLSQDSESPPSVATTQAENPETRPSPEVHEPEENCEEEGDRSKEEE